MAFLDKNIPSLFHVRQYNKISDMSDLPAVNRVQLQGKICGRSYRGRIIRISRDFRFTNVWGIIQESIMRLANYYDERK